ncbi:hypothetical protein [Streptomyces cavernicola]|uniref:Uncharacterized protein n=1 Tax=Streptomyces cavernicola TaxID=3043613 RepID=A0ABT6S6E1_9ACTN|nr:hypothetical protein [Streptomyces sp. B-S-A6]MDI3403666.1 hypothetical protein [Streptomyces sp. B-S-A6]
MTDPTGPSTGPDHTDFLDRLLARHRPAAPARPGVVRVQPRLAGPFERVEAVRGPAAEPEDTAPLWPTTPQPAVSDGKLGAPVREVRQLTERERTVVRTEREPAAEQPQPPRPAPPPPPAAPLLRPAADAVPRLRPVPDATRRTHSDSAPAAQRDTPAAALRPAGDTTGTPGRPVAALRPSGVDTAAAREAVRQSGARRRGQPQEQVVQVQIGRLEVTAAGRESTTRRPAARERREATVSLSDYLTRGRE